MTNEVVPEKLHAPQVNRKLVDILPISKVPTTPEEVSNVADTKTAEAVVRLQPVNPEDIERPTKGIPKIQQSFEDHAAKRANRAPRILPPNPQEAHERQLKRIERKKLEVQKLTMGCSRIIFVLNRKGGAGKTPVTAYAANIQMDITRVPTLCVDANEAGSIHDLFGISQDDTLQLRKAVHDRKTLSNYQAIAEEAYKHPSGVLLIASDPQKQPEVVAGQDKDTLTIEEYVDATQIWNSAFPPLYIDSGNSSKDVPNFGSAMVANVLIFVALADKDSTFGNIVETMIRYQDLGFGAKVSKGFVVINATSPGDTKQKYLDMIAAKLEKFPKKNVLNPETGITENVERRLEDLGITEDRLILIPFSSHIKADGVISTNQDVIGLDTYEAYLDLIIAIYRQYAIFPPMTLKSLSETEPVDASQPVTASVRRHSYIEPKNHPPIPATEGKVL